MGLANSNWATSLSNPLVDASTESKVQTFSAGTVMDPTDAADVGNAVSAGYYFVRISNTAANNLRVTPNADGTAGDLVAPGGTWEQAVVAGVKIYTIGTNAQIYNCTAFYPTDGQVGSSNY